MLRQQTRVLQKVTCAEACQMVEQQRQIGKAVIGEKQVIKKVMDMVGRKIEEEKKKMVTFIVGVINHHQM